LFQQAAMLSFRATSHGSQVLSPKSLEVNLFNFSRQEHGSWDLSFRSGSQVLSYVVIMWLLFLIGSLDLIGIYVVWWGFGKLPCCLLGPLTRVPSPKSWVTWGQYVQSQLSKAWKLGLTTSYGVPSPKVYECYVVTFFNWTPRYDWYVVWWGLKSKHHNAICLKEIGLRLQKLKIAFHSLMNIVGRTYIYS
jgi:hypothetical protein